jgi:hypothetical protein
MAGPLSPIVTTGDNPHTISTLRSFSLSNGIYVKKPPTSSSYRIPHALEYLRMMRDAANARMTRICSSSFNTYDTDS